MHSLVDLKGTAKKSKYGVIIRNENRGMHDLSNFECVSYSSMTERVYKKRNSGDWETHEL